MSAATAFTASASPIPGDVRLMHVTANVLYVLAGLALAALALNWVVRLPVFGLKAIHVEGEVARNSVSTIRANAAPKLTGNFFTTDLQKDKRAFESVPWVRQAIVRRIWPNRLAVRLEEHRPAAAWGSELVDLGRSGHINADSGIDEWPRGLRLAAGLGGQNANLLVSELGLRAALA